MKIRFPIFLSLSLVAPIMIGGCSGSGDSSNDGSTGDSAVKTVGVISSINSTNSLTVAGIKYDTSQSSLSMEDSDSDDSLDVGMVVTVEGSVDEKSHKGYADHVSYDAEIKGVVFSALDTATGMMNVMGQMVMVDDMTMFHSEDPNITSIDLVPAGAVVEVSGYVHKDGKIKATRVELERTEYQPDMNIMLKVKGVVTDVNMADSYFMMNDLRVDYDENTMFIHTSAEDLEKGMFVKVMSKNNFDATSQSILAGKVQRKKHHMHDIDDDDDEVKLYGTVTSEGVTDNQFELEGQPVLITDNTEFEHGTADDIVMGAKLKVEGYMNDDVLVAKEIEFSDHDEESEHLKIAGRVQMVNVDDEYLTIMGVNVYVNNNTWFKDHPHGECMVECPEPLPVPDTGEEMPKEDMTVMMSDMKHEMPTFGLGDVSAGDFVKIKAYLNDNGQIVAVKVERKMFDTKQQQQIKGPATSVMDDGNIAVMDIKVDMSEFSDMMVAVGDRVETSGMYNEDTMVFMPNELEVEGQESNDDDNYDNGESATEVM